MNEAGNSSVSKNLKYILVLVGVLALVASYFLVYREYNTKIEDIKPTIEELQTKCDDLEAKNDNKANIEKQTQEAEAKYAEILTKLDGGLSYQAEIMDAYNMGQKLQIKVPTLSLSPEAVVYTFGQIPTSNPNGGVGGASTEYSGVAMSYALSTIGTYDQMKQTLNYIMQEEGKRKVLDAVTFAYDSATQQVALSIKVTEYAVTGGDRVQKEVVIPEYAKSVPNVFYNEVIKLG